MAEPIEVLFMGCALGWAQGIVLDGAQMPAWAVQCSDCQ